MIERKLQKIVNKYSYPLIIAKIIALSCLLYCMFIVYNSEAKIDRFDNVTTNIFRGGNVNTYDDFVKLHEEGIDTIINLRVFADSQRYCEQFDIDCLHYGILLTPIPLSDFFFNYQTLANAFRALITAINKNKIIFIHCYAGKDRTGALVSALRIRDEACGEEYSIPELKDKLTKELEKYGFNRYIYPFLYSSIMNWAENPPSWICE
jgi:hypothetical protein